MKRTYIDCPYRQILTEQNQPARCDLLVHLSGIQDSNSALATVDIDVCTACCDSFSPTPDDWNPVIASMMHAIGQQIMDAGGVAGCPVEKATELCETAISHLPVVLPDEDDCVDDAQHIAPPREIRLEQWQEILPIPPSKHGKLTRWAVGVTTAPRRQCTLTPCLESLIASGWSEPHLFVDGPVEIDDAFASLQRTCRPEPMGAWPAWCAALRTLLTQYTDADALMIVQDDAMFPQTESTKTYVESMLWPGDRDSIVSLYTSTDDMLNENAWRPLPRVWVYGAVAMIFTPDQARDLLECESRGLLNIINGTAGIDTRIGHWADQRGIEVWHPSPSLVQHIGQVSSVWKRSRAVGLRRASRFIVDEIE
ncbi:hypothetical protein [Stieleria varia]|uniref:Uncharacterized protein n=1 Tax=Stieleria varia TaxID=2528005 RepID=A0A5C6B8G6_9BACT|nr:hypothetical protein [Stieleria varia]TWU08250.1 hypothetical protein Pla52n_08320 [Stieleria varia]